MKTILTLLSALLFSIALAQDSEDVVYIQVDYMKTLDGRYDDYVWMENHIYKPIHQTRIDNGEVVGWYLYQVQYPSGAGSEYDFVTLTFYANFSLLDNSTVSYEELVNSAHPDKSLEEVLKYAEDTRSLVKSEVFKSVARFPIQLEMPPRSLLIDFMKVKPVSEPYYVRMEKEIWMPMHQERKKRGVLLNWGLYELLFPGGLDYPYTHATATGFSKWDQIKDSWPDDIWSTVHPNASQEQLELRAHETRDLVSSQIWKLVDFTQSEGLSAKH